MSEKVLPIGWKKLQLKQDIELISGRHVLAENYSNDDSGMPYITGPSDFSSGEIKVTKYTEKPDAICQKNDILITVKGSGAGQIYFSNGTYCISRQLMAIRPKIWSNKFLFYYLANNSYNFSQIAQGLIPGISRDDILSYAILLPPLDEQRKIAEILSTWDEAIQTTEKLIAALEKRKKGLMQHLLTGQVRFPGFTDEWKEVKLADLIGYDGLLTDGDWIESKDQDDFGEVRLIQLADIGDGSFHNKSSKHLTKETAQRLNCTFLHPNDILIARMPDPIGRACILPRINQMSVTAVDVCIVRLSEKIDNRFITHIINSDEIRRIIIRKSGGSTRTRITRKELSRLMFSLPNYEEQKIISECLEENNKNIELVKSKQKLLQRQKQGLMQRLLTGQVRVSV